jgi:AraC-like DNA-binding protein
VRDIEASRRRLTELLNLLITNEGTRPSGLDGVTLMRSEHPLPRKPVLYEPSIVIVGQGRKRGYLGDQVYTYDPHNYLVLSVPMPFECEVEIGPEGPFLGVSIRVEMPALYELLTKMGGSPLQSDAENKHGMYSTPMNVNISQAVVRLLEALTSPADTLILGPQIVREITYRVLCGPSGASLRALISLNGHFNQIQRVLQHIHADSSQQFDVATLAKSAGMSVSAFHHNFKAVTANSPLQYLKAIRLHKARMLMLEGIGAGSAADRVGYESASQFSREFKRFFGATPLDEANRMRNSLRDA